MSSLRRELSHWNDDDRPLVYSDVPKTTHVLAALLLLEIAYGIAKLLG